MAAEDLRSEWNELYRVTLPNLARSRAPSQAKWPVTLDHCFGRIILDNAVGVDRPWAEAIKAPAVKNMSEEQLRAAIGLGKQIAGGHGNLVELDEKSLQLRGKTKGGSSVKRKQEADDDGVPSKKAKTRKGEIADIWSKHLAEGPQQEESDDNNNDARQRLKTQLPTPPATSPRSPSEGRKPPKHEIADAKLSAIRARIQADKSLTPFRQRVLTLLTQVPPGRYSTYKALAGGIASTSPDPATKSSARAVGSAMRNNPFAPQVPCHRVLAASGQIGGFGGEWGDEGRFAEEKRRLLREEGVKFDGKGRVVGSPFTAFR